MTQLNGNSKSFPCHILNNNTAIRGLPLTCCLRWFLKKIKILFLSYAKLISWFFLRTEKKHRNICIKPIHLLQWKKSGYLSPSFWKIVIFIKKLLDFLMFYLVDGKQQFQMLISYWKYSSCTICPFSLSHNWPMCSPVIFSARVFP